MPAENAVDDIARDIGKVRIAEEAIVLELALERFAAHAAPFVLQRGIERGAAAHRLRDQPVELARGGEERRPGRELAFPERPHLVRRHHGFAEAPDVLDDVHAVAHRAGRVVGVAEHDEAGLVRLVGGDRVGLRVSRIVLGEPCEIRLGREPVPHQLANLGLARAFRKHQPSAGMEEPREVVGVLASRPQRLGYVVERHHGGHAVVDVELAHVLFPVHMGVEQPGNDELAAEIDHLRARRHGGIGGEDVADDVSLDQQRAIPQRGIR